MGRALLVVLVVALVVVVCLDGYRTVWRVDEPEALVAAKSHSSEALSTEVAEETAPPVTSAPVERAVEAAVTVPVEQEPARVAAHIHGTVVVIDAQGRERPHESGRFMLTLISGKNGRLFEVDVHDGQYSIDAEPLASGWATEYRLQNIVLGGRDVRAPAERLPLPGDNVLDLRLPWIPQLVLEVRSRDTGRKVEDVHVVEPAPEHATGVDHPGTVLWAGSDVYRGGDNPVILAAPERGSRFVHVTSDGLAWKRVEVLPGDAERTVMLEPAGDLRVRTGLDPKQSAWLRLYPPDSSTFGHPLLEAELRSTPISESEWAVGSYVEALPVGPVQVTIQLGDRWSPRTLAQTQVEIRAGETTDVALAPDPLLSPMWVTIAGTLSLPSKWGLNDFEIVLTLQGIAPDGWVGQVELPRKQIQLDEATGIRRWSARVQPGTYSVMVPRTGYFTTLDVGEDGERNVHIEVPEPCLVRARCVDDASGTDAAVWGLDWGFQQDAGMIPGSTKFSDVGAGIWELRVPEGTIVVRAHREGQVAQLTAAVTSGVNEFVLRFPRMTGLRVILRDGDAGVPWEKDDFPSLTPMAGQDRPVVRGLFGERVTLEARAPGAYTLTVPDIPGYEPMPELVVHLEQDVVTDHVVQLRRRP